MAQSLQPEPHLHWWFCPAQSQVAPAGPVKQVQGLETLACVPVLCNLGQNHLISWILCFMSRARYNNCLPFLTKSSLFLNYLSTLFGWSGLSSSMHDLHCVTWDLSLWCTDSLVVVAALVVEVWVVWVFGSRCSMGYGILVPRPGIKPASPASQGSFLITGPPGKSHQVFFEHQQK